MGFVGLPSTFESNSFSNNDLLDRISALEPHWRDLGNNRYISSVSNGINNIACGLKDYPCKTITYILMIDTTIYSG